MSRKEFLAKSAAVALTVAGVPAILKTLTSFDRQEKGYGSSPYGGASERGTRL
jgi:hypothetical protein